MFMRTKTHNLAVEQFNSMLGNLTGILQDTTDELQECHTYIDDVLKTLITQNTDVTQSILQDTLTITVSLPIGLYNQPDTTQYILDAVEGQLK